MKSPHTHADLELNFLSQGSLRYRHGGRDEKLDDAELGFFWGGIPHQMIEASPVLTGIWLTLPIAWLLRWQLPGNLAERLFAGEFIRIQADAEAILRWQMDFEDGKPARLRVLQLELEAMFHRVGLSRSARPSRLLRCRPVRALEGSVRRIEQATTYLATHYYETLSLPKIARAVGVHPKYLARVFKTYCGLSVWEYLTRLRVAHAQRLLLTTDLKIIDVALESGFGSAAPFYAAFIRYGDGRRPGSFRHGDDGEGSRS